MGTCRIANDIILVSISPDPEFVEMSIDDLGGLVPDIYLYHSYETHFDLLVKIDSRVAFFSDIEGSVIKNAINTDTEKCDNVWKTVENRNSHSKKNKDNDSEKLLVEIDEKEVNLVTFDDEQSLLDAKNEGHRRTSPQYHPIPSSKQITMVKCTWYEKK